MRFGVCGLSRVRKPRILITEPLLSYVAGGARTMDNLEVASLRSELEHAVDVPSSDPWADFRTDDRSQATHECNGRFFRVEEHEAVDFPDACKRARVMCFRGVDPPSYGVQPWWRFACSS